MFKDRVIRITLQTQQSDHIQDIFAMADSAFKYIKNLEEVFFELDGVAISLHRNFRNEEQRIWDLYNNELQRLNKIKYELRRYKNESH